MDTTDTLTTEEEICSIEEELSDAQFRVYQQVKMENDMRDLEKRVLLLESVLKFAATTKKQERKKNVPAQRLRFAGNVWRLQCDECGHLSASAPLLVRHLKVAHRWIVQERPKK